MPSLLQIMETRRSVRRFKSDPVPDHLLEILARAAGSAPSAGNKQPWRFLFVTNRETMDAAVQDISEVIERIEEQLPEEYIDDFSRYAQNFTLFRSAPVLFIPLFRVFRGIYEMVGGKETSRDLEEFEWIEHHSALVSVSLAMQNALLMAHDVGLGACCMTGPLIAKNSLRNRFRVPEGWDIAAVIALGFPNEAPGNPGRKPVNSTIRWVK